MRLVFGAEPGVDPDTATAEFVFDMTAHQNSTLFQPQAKDFTVLVERNDGLLVPADAKTIVVTPNDPSISPGETYRVRLASTYIASSVSGFYRFRIASATWRYKEWYVQETGLKDFKTDYVSLSGGSSPVVVSIISSTPSSGAVDARSATWGEGATWDTWRDITLKLSAVLPINIGGFAISDFDVINSNGTINHPKSVTNRGEFLKVDVPIGAGNRVNLVHNPSGWSACYGYLPGDVDGNGRTNAQDNGLLRSWLASGEGVNQPIWKIDINRDGVFDSWDLTAEQAILGAGSTSLPDCPSIPTALNTPATQNQLSNAFSAISALLQSLRQAVSR